MVNIGLFLMTVGAYYGLWALLGGRPEGSEQILLRLGVLALLAMPFNVNDNIFTVAGNAVSKRNIYSLCSLFQSAEEDADMIFGVPCVLQIARRGTACVGTGVALLQFSEGEALLGVGAFLIQCAGIHASLGIGLGLWQIGDRSAVARCGVALYQSVGHKSRAFAVWSRLSADDGAA